MVEDGAIRRFIAANTEVTRPALVPEIRLRLATEVVPLWHATEQMLDELGIAPPYWAFCWPGGQALARFLLDRPGCLAGRRVLDFGSGCGIAAIAATQSGGIVVAYDIDPLALAAIRMNAELNGCEVLVQEDEVIGRNCADWDVVLAGDVCYERPLAERMIPWLRDCAARGTEVLLADPGRSFLPASELDPLANYRVPTSLELEGREQRQCTVFRFRPDHREPPDPSTLAA